MNRSSFGLIYYSPPFRCRLFSAPCSDFCEDLDIDEVVLLLQPGLPVVVDGLAALLLGAGPAAGSRWFTQSSWVPFQIGAILLVDEDIGVEGALPLLVLLVRSSLLLLCVDRLAPYKQRGVTGGNSPPPAPQRPCFHARRCSRTPGGPASPAAPARSPRPRAAAGTAATYLPSSYSPSRTDGICTTAIKCSISTLVSLFPYSTGFYS